MMQLIGWFLAALALSFALSPRVAAFARARCIMDEPKSARKIHNEAKPLLGGVAVYAALAATVLLILATSPTLTNGQITQMHYLGFLLGGLILMIGGSIDDRHELPPHISIFAPILAAFVAIAFGIEIEKLSNPFGGILYLESWQSDLLVFIWLMTVMYTTKFLDGLDGLATGISGIGVFVIMLLSLSAAYFQPDVALLSAASLGALLGFYHWNQEPSRLFLGEGGSTFVGYLLGILAVISGGKVATALLVLGIPLLDLAWVVLRRFKSGGIMRIVTGDRKHLHHRLLDLGWSHAHIVYLYVAVAAAFGGAALLLQSREKLIALLVLTILMLIAAGYLVSRERYAQKGG